MKKAGSLFSTWLVENEIIESDDYEIYAYGFWQGMVLVFNFFTIVIVGIVTHMLWQSIVFTLFYGMLRIFAGGFHARTQKRCYVCSVLLQIVALGTIQVMKQDIRTSICIAVLSMFVAFSFAPVEDENKPLDDVEIRVFKHRSRIISVFHVICMVIFLIFEKNEFASCVAVSILTVSIMLLLGGMRNRAVLNYR